MSASPERVQVSRELIKIKIRLDVYFSASVLLAEALGVCNLCVHTCVRARVRTYHLLEASLALGRRPSAALVSWLMHVWGESSSLQFPPPPTSSSSSRFENRPDRV